MSQLIDDLRAARALIAEPEHWMRGDFARDVNGKKVNAPDQRAVAFCAVGACHRVGVTSFSRLVEALERQIHNSVTGSVSVYNDSHTHAEVLALFDAAIAAAEREVSQ